MSFFIAFTIAYYLNVIFSRSVTSVKEERGDFVCYRLLFFFSLFEGVCFSSGRFEKTKL